MQKVRGLKNRGFAYLHEGYRYHKDSDNPPSYRCALRKHFDCMGSVQERGHIVHVLHIHNHLPSGENKNEVGTPKRQKTSTKMNKKALHNWGLAYAYIRIYIFFVNMKKKMANYIKRKEPKENFKRLVEKVINSMKRSNNLEEEKQNCDEDLIRKLEMQEVEIIQQNIEINDLKKKLEEQKALTLELNEECQKLKNDIINLKGNIRVFCRIRPTIQKEIEEKKTLCEIKLLDDCTIEIEKPIRSGAMSSSGQRETKQEFSFDKVFTDKASQEDLFQEVSLLTQAALEGYNVCVFAYGHTGSGKTYTMDGREDAQTEGIIPRAVYQIFKEIKRLELLGREYKVKVTILELYGEKIIDLLDAHTSKTHEIKMEDNKGQEFYVSNLQTKEIHSPEELHRCLQVAKRNRHVDDNQTNNRSSRSHAITKIDLIGQHRGECLKGTLNLIDLAGFERLKYVENVKSNKKTETETVNINKSLLVLRKVIAAIKEKNEHVPFRESRLTQILIKYIRGNSKTLMITNIAPLEEYFDETINSLTFAHNVSK